jgi:hypothetical protein
MHQKKKKKKKNKQGTEKEHAAEETGCSKHTGEGERGKEMISTQNFSKQRLEGRSSDSGQVISHWLK